MKTLLSKIINYPAHPVTVGLVGLASTQTMYAMNSDQVNTIAEATQAADPTTVIIQIIIGIATLWKLLRKQKNDSNNN